MGPLLSRITSNATYARGPTIWTFFRYGVFRPLRVINNNFCVYLTSTIIQIDHIHKVLFHFNTSWSSVGNKFEIVYFNNDEPSFFHFFDNLTLRLQKAPFGVLKKPKLIMGPCLSTITPYPLIFVKTGPTWSDQLAFAIDQTLGFSISWLWCIDYEM